MNFFFLLLLKQLIVSANLVFVVHREGTASEIDLTLAGTYRNSTSGQKGRQQGRQGGGGVGVSDRWYPEGVCVLKQEGLGGEVFYLVRKVLERGWEF